MSEQSPIVLIGESSSSCSKCATPFLDAGNCTGCGSIMTHGRSKYVGYLPGSPWHTKLIGIAERLGLILDDKDRILTRP